MRDELHKAESAVHELSATRLDRYYPRFHIAAEAGWLNDPNGMCCFQGRYHVYFQHHPFSARWGSPHWGHVSSDDLVTWRREPIAMAPSIPADVDGVYSGSAVVDDDGTLAVLYTGNVWRNGTDNDEGARQTQCLAVSADGVEFEKKGIVIDCPADVIDFRDPKVWKDGDTWYQVVGIRSLDNIGEVLLYTSPDLRSWEFDRVIYRADDPGVYMIECPDFIRLGDKWVLIICLMGMSPIGHDFRNQHNVGYVVGTWSPGEDFVPETGLRVLDGGANFYAPQSFEAPDGRRILTGWMGSFLSIPTQDDDGWCGQMTVLRELTLGDDNAVRMVPVAEFARLHTAQHDLGGFTVDENESRTLSDSADGRDVEIEFDLTSTTATRFGLSIGTPGGEEATVAFDAQLGRVVLDKHNGGLGERGYRSVAVTAGDSLRLRVLVDKPSVEVFVNEGEAVLSSFVFPSSPDRSISVFAETGHASVTGAVVREVGSIYEEG